ncbi:MAG: bifunctional UDP-N-acetylmuramoyl-tripeptide:D-alanyl-D-alanine ligase/alanine racemase [Flavobacteriales bacterium]|nr:bifunctional UDP-N-acetylmuramoyl-tripeptide:D-alanyl-D-alanine ligase/alanine racemase [Flavobacteriales bacterium]
MFLWWAETKQQGVMNYTIESIADFCNGAPTISIPGSLENQVIIDHREPHGTDAMFAALKGARVDGHSFIGSLIESGLHHFLVSDPDVIKSFEGQANFILVTDVVEALQKVAAEHRDNYNIPVIAITGSNGKTIVKEWLNQLLENEHSICRSPKSYNSQIGVPLSLFNLGPDHSLGIFEAGISRPDEMQVVSQMIRPTIGILTNIGDAHAAHFDNDEQKFREKWKLFDSAEKIVGCCDDHWFGWLSEQDRKRCFCWSTKDPNANVFIERIITQDKKSVLSVRSKSGSHTVTIPFTDKASIQNAIHCFVCIELLRRIRKPVIDLFEDLSSVAMRMEVKQGIEQSVIIDDSYNSDLGSLRIALENLSTQMDREKLVILSDFRENVNPTQLYEQIGSMLREAEVDEVVGIGIQIAENAGAFEPMGISCFDDVDSYWNSLDAKAIRNKAILIKGARKFRLENLSKRLQAKHHETVLEVDLHKMAQNLSYFRDQIKGRAKIMVMVKAFAYGSGGYEVAQFLEKQKIDYLGVAYADEGVELRKKGIRIPIMVMSPSKETYESMIQYDLEPEIYSLNSLEDFINTAKSYRHLFREFSIHLKIDSGMHRLGFERSDIKVLCNRVNDVPFVKIESIFTHLAATDDPQSDEFTKAQLTKFADLSEEIGEQIGYMPTRHALNSTGILRFPDSLFDMVRLGIGLYGFSGSEHGKFLHALGKLKSYIVQVRSVPANESVGYARNGVEQRERRIATVAIGYADGVDRRLGNGNWSFLWQDTQCKTVGNICMDMCMIDVTNTAAQEGDEVIVFAGSSEVVAMAEKLNTISYEILTKISERVRRVYHQE